MAFEPGCSLTGEWSLSRFSNWSIPCNVCSLAFISDSLITKHDERQQTTRSIFSVNEVNSKSRITYHLPYVFVASSPSTLEQFSHLSSLSVAWWSWQFDEFSDSARATYSEIPCSLSWPWGASPSGASIVGPFCCFCVRISCCCQSVLSLIFDHRGNNRSSVSPIRRNSCDSWIQRMRSVISSNTNNNDQHKTNSFENTTSDPSTSL